MKSIKSRIVKATKILQSEGNNQSFITEKILERQKYKIKSVEQSKTVMKNNCKGYLGI